MTIKDIPEKHDHPLAVAQMDQYGAKYFLKAEEVNAIVLAIKSLQERELNLQWKVNNWD